MFYISKSAKNIKTKQLLKRLPSSRWRYVRTDSWNAFLRDHTYIHSFIHSCSFNKKFDMSQYIQW